MSMLVGTEEQGKIRVSKGNAMKTYPRYSDKRIRILGLDARWR
jgi:hypothetical protein